MRALIKHFFAVSAVVLLTGNLPMKADSITLAFSPSVVTGYPGSVISFTGNITNTSSTPLYLNSLNATLPSGFNALGFDSSPFFANAPAILAIGSSTGFVNLFRLTMPATPVFTVLQGTVQILGGTTADGQSTLGQQAFFVTTAPEPATYALLAAGLAILAYKRRGFSLN